MGFLRFHTTHIKKLLYQWTFDHVCARGREIKSQNDWKYPFDDLRKETKQKKKEKQKTPLNHVNKSDIKYLFCKKKGYIKKSCPKFKAGL